jgi:hypothetical protein
MWQQAAPLQALGMRRYVTEENDYEIVNRALTLPAIPFLLW